MVEVMNLLTESIGPINSAWASPLILLFFIIIIVIYSIFIFYFCRHLGKKNILELNLNPYNYYESSGLVKFFAVIFYIIEYILILPILTFFWFAVLAILILIFAQGIETNTILLISAALVASVRVTSFISENLSKDLAKLLPFNFLAIAITTANFFSIPALINRVTEIPSLLSNIFYYLLFIIGIETVMRMTELFGNLFKQEEEKED